MKDSEELFQLIKSLSGPEKRYFKLLSTVYEGDKNYLKVFNIIVKQKNYNEQALRKKIRNNSILKQLPRVKNYLYEMVLHTISAYHANNSERSRINNRIEQIKHLMSRGLLKQSRKLILKSKKQAYRIEGYNSIMELLTIEKRIHESLLELEKVNYLDLEIEQVWNQMQVNKKYEVLNGEMFALISKEGKARNKKIISRAQKIIKHPLLMDERKATSCQAKNHFYQTHSFYNELKGNLEACYNYRKAGVINMEAQPMYLAEHQFSYIQILNNLVNIIIDLKKYDEVQTHLQKLRSINPQSENNKIWIFIYSYIIEKDFYLKSGGFEKGILLEKDVTEGLAKYKEKIPVIAQFIFLFNLSLLNFGSGKYSKSLHFLNQAMNLPYTEQRQDTQVLSKIFNLIVHFELGNEILFPYLVRSTYRYLLKQQRAYKYEAFILQFIRKLPKVSSQRKMKDAFMELKSAMEKLQNDTFEKHAFGNFDIISWLESKIQNRSFVEIVKEKAKKN